VDIWAICADAMRALIVTVPDIAAIASIRPVPDRSPGTDPRSARTCGRRRKDVRPVAEMRDAD